MSEFQSNLAYQDTLDFIYSFVDYSLTRNLRYSPEKFDLSRMRKLLTLMGNPQNDFPVIHVAGTKGKGSISAMCAAGMQAAGYKTGFYTSPHLEDFCERVQIDRKPIPHDELVQLISEMKVHIQQVDQITTFEIITALAFLYFSRHHVDIAVVEVGLGGRLDATNVVTPLVSVISSLSFDHMNVLGNTLTAIASEKAGIIKPGRPVVLAPQKPEAKETVIRIAQERNARVVEIGKDVFYTPLVHTYDGQSMEVWFGNDNPNPNIENKSVESRLPDNKKVILTIPLLGLHQIENAATAFAALKVAAQEGIPIRDEQIADGFSRVIWPGRFEILQNNPVLVVDSAHNRDSALRLRQAIDDYFPGRPAILLFGASEDKDISGMFAELLPRVNEVIVTQSVHPRAADADQLAKLVMSMGKPARSIVPVDEAYRTAILSAGHETVVVAAGSLFIAAAVRNIWKEKGVGIHSSESPIII